MFKTLEMMKKRDERGFTLIELLIVIAIIAILAAIAIPQFSAYRERAVRASMIADARNTATNLEAVFGDCQQYPVINVAAGANTRFQENTLANCANVPTVVNFDASRGNAIAVAVNGQQYAITVTNATGAGAGWSPLTVVGGPAANPPSCTFANNTAC